AKVALGLDYDLPLGIVYIGGYLEAGAEGEYHFTGGDFILILYLKGGIKGGVIAPWGKRYNIINFYLGAQGTLSKGGSSPWKLAASCEVGYSLKLFLFKVGGTVHADFKKNL
ncbi:MAG: hypothetical protein FWG61_01130, partial [Firmicutes bacterium]|nr:hypothetical protein [Bacillota bacterium]